MNILETVANLPDYMAPESVRTISICQHSATISSITASRSDIANGLDRKEHAPEFSVAFLTAMSALANIIFTFVLTFNISFVVSTPFLFGPLIQGISPQEFMKHRFIIHDEYRCQGQSPCGSSTIKLLP